MLTPHRNGCDASNLPACITEHADGDVTFKIVAGPDRRKSASVARDEFANWAKYEVVLKGNEWVKLTPDRYREPE